MMNSLMITILVGLSFLDTVFTYEWARACIKWKPTLKFNQVESNPFIVVCWKNFGIPAGSIISGTILMGVQFGLSAIHINVFYIITGILLFANLNHARNFWVLKNRLKKDKEDE